MVAIKAEMAPRDEPTSVRVALPEYTKPKAIKSAKALKIDTRVVFQELFFELLKEIMTLEFV